jgi:hypothetical protein
MHVSQGFEAPMQLGEVQSVLIDLATGGGAVARRCASWLCWPCPAASPASLSCWPSPFLAILPAPRRASALSSAPLIEEVDGSESDASSVGSAANGLMASVDGSHYLEATDSGSSSALELLAATVTNVVSWSSCGSLWGVAGRKASVRRSILTLPFSPLSLPLACHLTLHTC